MADAIKVGIIGGTGIGNALGAEDGEKHDIDTPFGKPSAPLISTQWSGVDIVILPRHGVGHTINPTLVPYQANIYAMKAMGVTHIIATGATGSLREEVKPRDLIITDQYIDKTYKRANTFYNDAAVHVEMAQPFCPITRHWLLEAGKELMDVDIHDKGTYVCMEGPAFSTRAESLMHRTWGGDLIGMTLMPEAKLAKEAEIAYGHIAVPTDYDAWKPHDPNVPATALLDEIIGNLTHATENVIKLIKAALANPKFIQENPSPSHKALDLAIFTYKSNINLEAVKALEVLWGRHFT